jgi:hypothetical protein
LGSVAWGCGGFWNSGALRVNDMWDKRLVDQDCGAAEERGELRCRRSSEWGVGCVLGENSIVWGIWVEMCVVGVG